MVWLAALLSRMDSDAFSSCQCCVQFYMSGLFSILWKEKRKAERQTAHLGMCSSSPTSASGPPQLPFTNHSRLPSLSVEGPSLFFVWLPFWKTFIKPQTLPFGRFRRARERAVWRGSDKFGESVGEKWVNITWLLHVDSHTHAVKLTLKIHLFMDEIRNTFSYFSIYFTLANNVRCLKGAFHFRVGPGGLSTGPAEVCVST